VPVIGFVGRATFTKGLDIFIDVCAELARRQMQFTAIVTGDGHYLREARERAERLGIGSVIKFTASVPHATIGSIFQSIDIYLSPARNGAFSNTTLEALAAGCCVIALSPDPRTEVDATTQRFLPEDMVSWADRADPVRSCADLAVGLLSHPSRLRESRARGGDFARAALRPWAERIKQEVDLLENLALTGETPHGTLPGDELARAALEAAPT
jgi:glycosyltransferase involved in cell wall biosynthesis